MSIYAHLLDTALGHDHSDETATTEAALAQLLECRNRLSVNLSSYTGADWAPAAIADQLAYDVALVELSRSVGIEVDLSRFGQPRHERARLEHDLARRGIGLEVFDEPTESMTRPHRKWGQRQR